MAKTVPAKARKAVTHAVGQAAKSIDGGSKSGSPLSGARGIAAGAGAAALVPLAAKGVGKLLRSRVDGKIVDGVKAPGKALGGVTSKLGDSVGGAIGDKVTDKVDQAGGPGGIVKEGLKSALPFGGDSGGSGGKGGMPGVGKGRRMPVQQSVDIAVPIETVYNQWTQFEQWPEFMHRVTRVTQKDDCTVSFATKIWAKTKEFTAEIETQRPDERIKWRVTNGITHTGVVTFHELAPRLTRVELGLDVQPGGMLEKAARGMRHIKRAARADLHRFKALIEMQEQETGAWRGVIEDGEVVEEHDSGYDSSREYSDLGEARSDNGSEEKQESGGRQQSSSRGRSRSGSSSPGRGASAQKSRSSRSPGRSGSGSTAGSGNGSSSRSGNGSSSRSGSGSSSRSGSGSSRSGGASSARSSGGSSSRSPARSPARSRGRSSARSRGNHASAG